MAAFSYQHPFPRPFFIDSVFPQQSTTTTTVTDISAPTGLFMEEPAGILSSSFPQFYPPELFLQQGVYGSFDSSAGGLPQNYGFSNDCSIDDGDNVEEEEASVVTRKQSTDGGGGHSSTTESSGEQVTQFKSAPPPSAAAMDLHTKKRKKMTTVVVKPNNNKNNLSNASSHLTSAHSKEAAREAGKSSKKAKKSCDVEVEEETKKKKNQKQGKTGEEVKQQSKKAQVQQRKKGAAAADDKELPPTGYIHVRARRGQATDSHSLAERARREKISERMKLLQHLVPGCDKVTGKALMLDEIINYIQSLQSQVEFLSMKLASVNPLFYEFGLDLDGLMVRPESQRLSSNNNVVASPPLPPPGQQCNPTTATTATVPHQPHQHTSNFATTTNAAAAAFPLIGATTNSTSAIFAGQRQGDFSQSQDNGGNLLWDMEVEVGRQKLVNQSGFGIGSTTTTTNNNFCSSFQ